ncbi:MAG: hypothetical protein A3C30_00145 [Candidatus Levybacteria bacterium RIFCSPHIGHO2_02_FULL_40_18]|nr:MAG: hypothetical protein A2869_03840 [Candidatus Levybacteria bacterium RIFCSPHIGHO2_01_FULL_40_58]OGH27114.1 MAG: hypothetical protein A3C30_00145 [Candidatus Levybacteria bacterium RIFCSPHIGHO2_02_FULL_40_18]OGH30973.1 MAG: hypothetical protein A3E43_04560 [Candidatus Levybacteria bacterium RIFCSPHIGHO2_12_FULL_40_31]OGH40984.1 MAG: hypothetical protein A2894_01775 [Candidatus Levybacteria bacterium RIFCSPLOWO2_01_FULL_40_64]OGH48939.1 MAG: hypothetical protein A3I54_02780 [Candidatus Lev
MVALNKTKMNEEQILNQVPVYYYQEGIKKNILQRAWHLGKLKAVLSMIDKYPDSILDVGCASGWFLSKVSRRYPKAACVGIDKYKKAIYYGKKRYKSLKFLYADAHKLPFRSNSFDLVIATEVLEHVTDPTGALKEIKRVLKKEGSAIIEMDSGNFLFGIVWHWWTNIRKGVWRDAHLHLFTAKKLSEMLGSNGFIVSKKKMFNYTMGVAFLLKKR